MIFSTNAAETSVTIDGVTCVVDSGMAKEKSYDASKGMGVLALTEINRSSADQRKGRAGRKGGGQRVRGCQRAVLTPERSVQPLQAEPLAHALS